MSARTLVYRAMAFAPAIFLVGLGIRGRTLSTDYEFVANDPCTEHRIQAYCPYLRKSAAFLGTSPRATPNDARAAARNWISGAERGDLKPLAPIAYDDTSSDGAKSLIFDIEERISAKLETAVLEDVRVHDHHQAAQDSILLLQLSSILKYSDFLSLYHDATAQRRVLQQIDSITGSLNSQDRAGLAQSIRGATSVPGTIAIMVGRSKELFLKWRDRKGFEPLAIEDTNLLGDVPALAKDGTLVAMHQLRTRVLASRDDHLPAYCSSLRLGVSAQERADHDSKELLAKLTKPTLLKR